MQLKNKKLKFRLGDEVKATVDLEVANNFGEGKLTIPKGTAGRIVSRSYSSISDWLVRFTPEWGSKTAQIAPVREQDIEIKRGS